MMSQYLSTDTASVQDATKDMQVVSPYGTQSVVVRDTPSNSYDAVCDAGGRRRRARHRHQGRLLLRAAG
ncbi:MAG: hypothetical protein ACLUHE_09245 [Christensenellales bacterium]